MSSDDIPDEDGPAESDDRSLGKPIEPGESLLLTYVVPFTGIILISVGIPLTVLGGYVVLQDTFALCGDPTIEVDELEPGEQPSPTVERVDYDELSQAEKRAVEEATTSTLEEGTVTGEMDHRDALLNGIITEVDNHRYYVQISSRNACLEAGPLLFPIGLVGILLGTAGILTPPIYRKMVGFEERMQRRR